MDSKKEVPCLGTNCHETNPRTSLKTSEDEPCHNVNLISLKPDQDETVPCLGTNCHNVNLVRLKPDQDETESVKRLERSWPLYNLNNGFKEKIPSNVIIQWDKIMGSQRQRNDNLKNNTLGYNSKVECENDTQVSLNTDEGCHKKCVDIKPIILKNNRNDILSKSVDPLGIKVFKKLSDQSIKETLDYFTLGIENPNDKMVMDNFVRLMERLNHETNQTSLKPGKNGSDKITIPISLKPEKNRDFLGCGSKDEPLDGKHNIN